MTGAREEQSACAHNRVIRHTVPAGLVQVQPTDTVPGGLVDTVRDVWRCDLCQTEFQPATGRRGDG